MLVDSAMVASEEWRNWCEVQASAKRKGDLLLICTVTPHFANLGAAYGATNAIRLDRIAEAEQSDSLRLLVTHTLARWFAHRGRNGRVRLFISHAKAKRGTISGRDLALGLKQFIDQRPAGERFFDEVDITAGEDFEFVLKRAIRESVVVVLLTDIFSSRFWCGMEVTTAKELHRPVVVVDALEQGEPISLAYIGKNPTVRWETNSIDPGKDTLIHARIVATALLEQLRLAHDEARLSEIREVALKSVSRVKLTARPPELATLPDISRRGQTLLLHTDPPLPRFELDLIRRQRPDLQLASAAQALSGCYAGSVPLVGYRIAISISDPPEDDRKITGLSKVVQERLWAQLATHLISAGAELAYGGDVRAGGYTEKLIDLATSSADAGRPLPRGIVHWYAGWPTAAKLSQETRAKLPRAFRLHEIAAPDAAGATNPEWPPNDPDPEHRFAWTLCTRAMRLAMAKECHARVLVGGPLRSVSPWPGLLEEFETFVVLRKPVFLVGGFGGITRRIIDALEGGAPKELTQTFQDEGRERQALREHYETAVRAHHLRNIPLVDWSERILALQNIGIKGLGNGLTLEENKRLFVSRSVTEIIALILEGLRQLATKNRL
ncbi:hypothetical protein [Corallococcus sp. AB030]|uniref:hypothetical protein n=1 Tax=Corallococcus TaxID=83461 RepID=UPI001F1650C7|nr:hypothetical protein [Corallococcus sp. AB030]